MKFPRCVPTTHTEENSEKEKKIEIERNRQRVLHILLQISSAENRLKSLAIPLEAFKLLSYNFGANHTKKAGTMAFWDS